ncbi:MAG: hypothetical protein HWN67_05585 [Candidatus Helarchaeota archaeon]|nr:hypothetical protein [Candidatus Helarchaeota archaeon]
MESEGEKPEEGLIDYKAECEKKDETIDDLKRKLGEYTKKTMLLINEKNELKKLLDNKQGQNPSSETLLSPVSSDQLLTKPSSGALLEESTSDSEALVNYKAEVEKRDKIITEMSANFKEYSQKTMEIIDERNDLKKEIEELQEKLQIFENKEGKIEGIWKRKVNEAERKVRAVEKILEQKNKDLSEVQSRYIAEVANKDKKLEELLLKIVELERKENKEEKKGKKG